MTRITKTLFTALTAVALATSALVFAAPPEGMGGPGMMMDHGGRQGGDMAAMATQRLAQLKTELKITGAQEAAFTAFSGKALEQAKGMQALRQKHMQAATPATKLSAPDAMAQHLGDMKAHLASMEGMQAAMRDLYAVLTPEQRAVADQHFAKMHAMHGGPGRQGGRHAHGQPS